MQDLDVPKQNQLPRTWLYELYRQRKARNETYSLRAFARSIGLSAALTSQILSGKSSLTRKSAEVIADRLSLSPKQKRTLVLTAMGLAPSGGIKAARGSASHYYLLEAERFKSIAEWQHYAILALADVQGNRSAPEWISRRLGISRTLANSAFTRLKKLGLIEENSEGGFRQTTAPLSTPEDVPSTAVKFYHKQNLQKAMDAIDRMSVNERHLSSTTVAVDQESYLKIVEEIRALRRKIAEISEQGQGNRKVHTIAFQLFPVDQGEI
jgi:transcriptional regulator with XRE-family HTH domain